MFENKAILYLEDEPLIAMDTGDHLEDLGFDRVHVAYRLATAEQLSQIHDFDFALFDINVDRGQTSLDLGRALAKQGTQVIFASGNSNAGRELVEEGFVFLDKPFAHADLTAELMALSSAKTVKRFA